MWWDELTMDVLRAQNRELNRNPPPEFFLASYFMANFDWQPPDGRRVTQASEEDCIPKCDLPEFED